MPCVRNVLPDWPKVLKHLKHGSCGTSVNRTTIKKMVLTALVPVELHLKHVTYGTSVSRTWFLQH